MVHREEVTSKVNLLDTIAGEPAYLLIAQRATRRDGKQRTITQKVPVLDVALFSRFCATVTRGDEFEVTIVTEWSKQGYATYVSDFRALLPSSESNQTPIIAAKASSTP
jgi:hypothetical protein